MIEDALSRLEALVGFSTACGSSNEEICAWIKQDSAGLARVFKSVRAGDPPLHSVWIGFGPEQDGGVLLSGHLDVVPAGNGWSRDPWAMRRHGNRVYGRGCCDMKGFIACVLAASRTWLPSDLSVPVYVALSSDEETGSARVPALIDSLRQSGIRPDCVVVGEPTGMRCVVGHKGTFAARTTIYGRAAHSADPLKGVNAGYGAAKLLAFMKRLQDEFCAMPAAQADFAPPYTTVNPGIIHGGVARNTVPDRAVIEWDCRIMPGETPEDVLGKVRSFCDAELGEYDAVVTEQLTFMPALVPSAKGRAIEIVKSPVAGPGTACVSYATEAGFFQHAGWPTLVCGPGSIAQAHRADEYIEIEQLEACLKMLVNLPGRVDALRRGAELPIGEVA